MKGSTLLALVFVFIGCLFALAINPHVASAQTDRELYDNDVLFNQLSTAAQIRLELLFGRKGSPVQNVLPEVLPRHYVEDDEEGYVGNILVNNPNLDLGAQDTQSETTIVLGAGSNVCSA